jgi:hypothetical protein
MEVRMIDQKLINLNEFFPKNYLLITIWTKRNHNLWWIQRRICSYLLLFRYSCWKSLFWITTKLEFLWFMDLQNSLLAHHIVTQHLGDNALELIVHTIILRWPRHSSWLMVHLVMILILVLGRMSPLNI